MAERKRDWDVHTGWEKRIRVDFGSIGPNHVRWSDWTYKERDIVARKVHEAKLISDTHGSRSKRMQEWAKENAPIMIGFARDGKPMPDWAHADYRESGIPEHVKVVWHQPDNADVGDWIYSEKPFPEYEDTVAGPPTGTEPVEPAWSAVPETEPLDDGNMHSKFGGVISYKERPNGDHVASDGTVISTRESRAKEDIPQWKKFEVGRLEEVDGQIIPGPNALPKDEEQYGENVKLTNIHKTRKVEATHAEQDSLVDKMRVYAQEVRPNSPNHQTRWQRALIALGDVGPKGMSPMTLAEAKALRDRGWKRWIPVVDAMGALAPPESAPETAAAAPEAAPEPEATPAPEVEGEWRLKPTANYGKVPPKPGATGWYTRRVAWLPDWYWALPEITHEEAEAQKVNGKASVAPMNYIYTKKGVGIVGRLKRSPERTDLPIWTKDEAAAYYTRIGIKMRSVTWLDGHLMTRKGYSTTGDNRGEPIARAADEDYEAAHRVVSVPNEMADAIAAGDWDAVQRLAEAKSKE